MQQFRPMRRFKQQLTNESCVKILENCAVPSKRVYRPKQVVRSGLLLLRGHETGCGAQRNQILLDTHFVSFIYAKIGQKRVLSSIYTFSNTKIDYLRGNVLK